MNFSGLINALCSVWTEWMKHNNIAIDKTKSFKERREAAEMAEKTLNKRYELTDKINEYFKEFDSSIIAEKKQLSKAAKDARKPLPPEMLVDALQDTVHKEVGHSRPAKAVRTKYGPRAQCLKCGDIIQSKHVHDFVTCRCGDYSIDGGGEYTRGVYKENGFGYKILDEEEDNET